MEMGEKVVASSGKEFEEMVRSEYKVNGILSKEIGLRKKQVHEVIEEKLFRFDFESAETHWRFDDIGWSSVLGLIRNRRIPEDAIWIF